VDDRTPVPYLANGLIGQLFGDRGYISKKLTKLLATQDLELITTLKKNRKPRVLAAFDKLMLSACFKSVKNVENYKFCPDEKEAK
jgi:hypothetical protein